MQNLKRVVAVMFVFSATFFTAFNAKAQQSNDKLLFAAAHSVPSVNQCVAEARKGGWNIRYQTETTGICFVDGFLSTVSIYKIGRCHSPEMCSRVRLAAFLVAEVNLDCENNVIGYTCY